MGKSWRASEDKSGKYEAKRRERELKKHKTKKRHVNAGDGYADDRNTIEVDPDIQ